MALLLSALVLAAPPLLAGAAVQDSPYIEYVSRRLTGRTQPTVAAFGQLPVDVVVAEPMAVGGVPGVLLLGKSMEGALALVWAKGLETTSSTPSFLTVDLPAEARPVLGLAFLRDTGLCVVSSGRAVLLRCELAGSGKALSCSAAAKAASGPWTTVLAPSHGVVATAVGGSLLFFGSDRGLFAVSFGEASSPVHELGAMQVGAVAHSDSRRLLVAGNGDRVWYFLAGPAGDPYALDRWEWVTDVPNARGGVFDDSVAQLAFALDHTLWVATPVCLNAQTVNGTVRRVSGHHGGLPYNLTTSVLPAVGQGGAPELWVGTQRGAALQLADGSWRYFNGPRYLPAASNVTGIVALGDGLSVVVVTASGSIAVITQETWNLEKKAAHYHEVLQRHDRLGLVAECSLRTYGDTSRCQNHDSDNNGLWTSLVVAAEAYRYAATGLASAADSAWHFFGGMKLLNDITGIRGLMARSVVRPGEAHQSGSWHNSTVKGYEGWVWKGDTSSDEVDGHFFAYSVLVKALQDSGHDLREAGGLIVDIATYLVDNGFVLIDVTGNRTTWGVWSPGILNENRDFSDERGLNSLQILAYLCAAANYSKDARFDAAFEELFGAKHQYGRNMVNVKITTPCDDNYSDDELGFLPYHTYLSNCMAPGRRAPALLSLERSWRFISAERSNLWNTIFAIANPGALSAAGLEDIAWNLRTWPLELVDWPVANSHRHDLWIDPNSDRFGRVGSDSMRVLPANERPQLRWNSNPHDLDGGSGTSEGDPGAWLLPYWMARAHGLISPPTKAQPAV